MSEYDLKREFDIEPLDRSAATQEDVFAMWVREGGLPEAEARRRLSEVALVGTTPEGDLAGVTTAYIARSPQLGMDLWHMRGYTAAAHRASNLASNMVFATKALLRAGFREGREPRAPGIVIEVENLDIERVFPQAVWPVSNFAFFGVAEGGAHLRVHWFEGGRVPTSPPVAY